MARTRQETRWRVGGETKRARLRAAMVARQAEGAQELGLQTLQCLHPAEYPINLKLRTERPPKNIIYIYGMEKKLKMAWF
jgi:hypothetical protein